MRKSYWWLMSGDIEEMIESTIIAYQNQILCTNHFKRHFEKKIDSKCRFCNNEYWEEVSNALFQGRNTSIHLVFRIIAVLLCYISGTTFIECLFPATTSWLPVLNDILQTEELVFEVFMVVTMKNGVFWDVTPCGSCKS
jgi:hypothetical protein